MKTISSRMVKIQIVIMLNIEMNRIIKQETNMKLENADRYILSVAKHNYLDSANYKFISDVRTHF